MKISEFKKLIREEVQKVITERSFSDAVDPKLKAQLQKVAKDRKRYQEDENIFNEMQSIITQIIIQTGMSKSEAKSLASGIMEDETTLSGNVNLILGTIQDAIEEASGDEDEQRRRRVIKHIFGDSNTKTYEVMGSGPNGITVAYLEKGTSTDQGMIRVRENKDVYQYKGSFDQMIKELIDKKVLIKKGTNKYQINNPSVNSTDRIAQYHSDIDLMKKAILKNPNFKKK